MLKETFEQLAGSYSDNRELIKQTWQELEHLYSGKGRYYHTLLHLEHLLAQLSEVKPLISDWNTMLFTLFYHDMIYNVKKSDNEEQSALLAEKRLAQLQVPASQIRKCREQILATKSHVFQADQDTNFFTDADLSVLGLDWEMYQVYAANVRKEYAIYPDLLYYPGRKKVLDHFLSMERIYKTDHFHDKLEARARENLERERMECINRK